MFLIHKWQPDVLESSGETKPIVWAVLCLSLSFSSWFSFLSLRRYIEHFPSIYWPFRNRLCSVLVLESSLDRQKDVYLQSQHVKERQEDQEFEDSLDCIVNSRPDHTTITPCLKIRKRKASNNNNSLSHFKIWSAWLFLLIYKILLLVLDTSPLPRCVF